MITVTYYYSACVGIETFDVSILCDPWFSEGIYDGSWYHYPPIASDPVQMIGAYDYIFISHIHPDHYDPAFLKTYLTTYPKTKIIIADLKINYLARKMNADGIPYQLCDEMQVGETYFKIVPNARFIDDIDTALAVRWQNQSVVNMNDNSFNAPQIKSIQRFLGQPPTIALLGYTGAGPYPQTYFDDSKTLVEKSTEKKQTFFKRYIELKEALSPQKTIPFAGKYILGGRLYALNPYRGVADAVEVTAFDPNAVVLADGGKASINTQTLIPTATRAHAYDLIAMQGYAASLADKPMKSDVYFAHLDLSAVPFLRLMQKAYANAILKSHCERDYTICILLKPAQWFTANIKANQNACQLLDRVDHLTPRSELTIDLKYLFGLLTGVFHWNNAEVGSQYLTRRFPDEFDISVQGFLNFFHV